jgi:hypothetical protein
MASTYSSNLKIELMGTGENAGTWGNITNTNLGTAYEQAVIGLGNPDYTSDANLTITLTNSNAAQAARALVLNVTSVFGSLTQTRELIVPTIQKQYIVQNNTTGGQSITVKTSGGTGITVPNGRKAHLYVDGTNVIQMFDFVDINGGTIDGATVGAASASTGAFTSLTASGATTLNGAVALGDASGDLITVPGTVNSNLLFTDATYDIGASGATRPRDLFLSRNLTVGGTLTLAGGVNLNGNVTVGDSSADTLTINSTITSNLIFTDNTYDIGASGATRPRSLFLAGNITAAGNQTLTGALTVDSTTDSTSTTTGSIQTDGGLGVAKALFVGTTANIAGVATFSAGSAAAPAITTTGDTNTGMWFPAADTIAFTEGGVESMRIDASGNLGLGVTPSAWSSAARALQIGSGLNGGSIVGDISYGILRMYANAYYDAGDKYVKSGEAASSYELWGYDGTHIWKNAPVNSGAAGAACTFTSRMTLDASGNLGVGTTSPAAPVHASLSGSNNVARFASTTDGSPWINWFTNGVERLRLTYSSVECNLYTLPAIALVFGTNNTERARIDSSGNLCVGSSSAGNAGTVNVSVGNPGTTVGGLQLWSTTSATHYVHFGDGASSTDPYRGYVGYTHASDALLFGTSSTERMRIDSAGNVGIGTTTPSTFACLGVNKAITTGSVLVSAGFSDSSFNTLRITHASGSVGLNFDDTNLIFQSGGTTPTTRMTINSSGQFMIGTTTPLDIATVVMNGSSNGNGITVRAVNSTAAGSQPGIVFTSSAGAIAGQVFADVGSSSLNLNNGAGGATAFLRNNTESARFDSSGNFGINTSSPATYGAFAVRKAVTTGDTTNCSASFSDAANSTFDIGHETNIVRLNAQGSAIAINAGSAERARITSGGNFLIGATSGTGKLVVEQSANTINTFLFASNASYTDGVLDIEAARNTTNSSYNFIQCAVYGVAYRFYVRDSGNVENTNNSYGAISDVKLKDNIIDASPKLADLMQVKVRQYNFKSDQTHKQIGVIAQELEQIFPAMIEESPDKDMEGNDLGTTTKSVKYSVFVPMLIKAMQEQQAIIESLKARLDAANL